MFGAFGLSAAIITQLFKFFFVHDGQEDLGGFFLSLSVALAFLGIMGFLAIHSVPLLIHDETAPLLSNDFEQRSIEKTQGRQGMFGTIGGTKLFKVFEFYLLVLSFFICAGVGFTFINILGGVIHSWKVDELSSATFVIILSLSNFSGRFIMGNLIDLLRKKFPVSGIMIVPAAMVGAGYTLIAVWPNFVALKIATILIASSYGAFWTGYNFVMNTFFGDTYHGSNFGFLSMGAGIGSIVMNIIAGKIYDSQVDHNNGNHKCYGTSCYLFTFILAAGFVVLAMVMIVVLAVRERRQSKLQGATIIVN
jgi:MFS family permease